MAKQSWLVQEVQSGHIRPFYGLRADIPSGWVECDGNNGTAAGQNANETGGSSTHSHAAHPALIHTGGAVGAIAASSSGAVKIGTSASSAAASGHTHPAPSFTQPDQHAVVKNPITGKVELKVEYDDKS